jgi:Fe-S-cluster containining protein
LLRRLGLDFPRFYTEYCTLVDTGAGLSLSLREITREGTNGRESHDCILWSDLGCSVYEDRPLQCSTYPFWAPMVESRSAWRREGLACPGIDTGKLRSRDYIEECLLARREAGTIVLSYDADPESADEDTILGG